MKSDLIYKITSKFKDLQPYDINQDEELDEYWLEWYSNTNFLVNLTVNTENVYYAYLLNEDKGHGSFKLKGNIPRLLLMAIRKVREKTQ